MLPASFEDHTALFYAGLCSRVYSDPPQYGHADGSARARVYGSAVVFRGTDNPASLLTDGDILTAETPLGTLHQGFWDAWLTVEAQLLALRPPIVSGHSLGGALAVIYAGMLCLQGTPPSAVYCFEPPRLCMDDKLRGILTKAGVMVWASCNAIDPIPWVPPLMSFPAEYAHIGALDIAHLDPLWYHEIADVRKALTP